MGPTPSGHARRAPPAINVNYVDRISRYYSKISQLLYVVHARPNRVRKRTHLRKRPIVQNAWKRIARFLHHQPHGAGAFVFAIVAGPESRHARAGNLRQGAIEDANDLTDGSHARDGQARSRRPCPSSKAFARPKGSAGFCVPVGRLSDKACPKRCARKKARPLHGDANPRAQVARGAEHDGIGAA